MRTPSSAGLASGPDGFLSDYSTSALEEDKAEVFSFLMTEPNLVRDIARSDPVVQGKVAAIRVQVEAQLPGLTNDFWSELEHDGR